MQLVLTSGRRFPVTSKCGASSTSTIALSTAYITLVVGVTPPPLNREMYLQPMRGHPYIYDREMILCESGTRERISYRSAADQTQTCINSMLARSPLNKFISTFLDHGCCARRPARRQLFHTARKHCIFHWASSYQSDQRDSKQS